jgi:predicted RNA-binding protein with EMAP domain
MAQRACDVLHKCLKQKPATSVKISREKRVKLLSTCDSAVKTMMYMYQVPEVLASSEPLHQVSEAADTITHAYGNLIDSDTDQSMLRANLRWCLRILQGLKVRFNNPGISLASGIDLMVVQIRNITRGENVSITRVQDGVNNYTVVTNLKKVESSTHLAAAFLPPRSVGGTVSEAMFLGDSQFQEPPGTLLNEQVVDAQEAASLLYAEVYRQSK